MLGSMKITSNSCRSFTAKNEKILLEAQRAWVKFREANCKFLFRPEGGTAALLDGRDCFLQATAERAKELKNLTRDDE